MTNFDVVNFSECRSEEMISFFLMLSVESQGLIQLHYSYLSQEVFSSEDLLKS